MDKKTVLGWLDSQQKKKGTNGNGPVTKAREDDPHHTDGTQPALHSTSVSPEPLTEARGDDPETAARLDDSETRAREDD